MDATRRGRPLGKGHIDHAVVDATTEADTRRHMIEDGLDPDSPLKGFRSVLRPASIRARVGMSQERFAKALGVPLSTLRNWEQGRTPPGPAAQSLLKVVNADPEAAFAAIGGELVTPL